VQAHDRWIVAGEEWTCARGEALERRGDERWQKARDTGGTHGGNRPAEVNINYPDWDTFAPFGGYKQSGNGREYADWAIHDFLEVKGIIGYGTEQP
jgi:hypothetical protein